MKKCLIILSLLLAGSVQSAGFSSTESGSKPTSDDLQKSTKLLSALFDYFNNDRDQRSLEQYSRQKYGSVTDDSREMYEMDRMDRRFQEEYKDQELDPVVIYFLKIQPINVLLAASQNSEFQKINPQSSNLQDWVMLKIFDHLNFVLNGETRFKGHRGNIRQQPNPNPNNPLMEAVIAYGQAQLNYAQTLGVTSSNVLPYANERLLAEKQMPSVETRLSIQKGTLQQLNAAESIFNKTLVVNKSLINTTVGSADMTPLMMALRYHSPEMVKALLAAGATTNWSDYSGPVTSTESTGVTTYLNNNNFKSTKDLYNALENLLTKSLYENSTLRQKPYRAS